MRLINTTTLELKTAYGYGTPLYAILSHTWGDDEFLFEHLQAGITQHQKDTPSRGLSKILETCQRAKNDGLEYAWVDTCCIDKSSSAELSEAINSMFRWYEDSAACYIYLEDVSNRGRQGGVVNISHSRWFRRGWTLQELIAPYGATFFDKDWNEIGTRTEISEHIVAITGIDNAILERQHAPVDNIDVRSPVGRTGTMYRCGYCNDPKTLLSMMQQHSVGARMHWAARRATTRQEDTAYCLLGLFGINMPLLYGEGDKAFARLQGEIVRRYPADQSILAWLGYDVSHWAELSLEFALEDAVSQRIVLTDCDPFDVLLRNRNGWTTPPSSVAHIEILPAFPTFISSPQLIETPTGNITFGPSLAVEPLPMKIQSIFEYRFVEIEGIIYLSRVGSNGFLIIYAGKSSKNGVQINNVLTIG
ncbi:hypothetical protein D7B24_000436 [Verticillium nonalfalfae]|uniref:Uncharacterized protein n=1 Tax=Verticillium nonalfalfae TaxID=1051616 RepID=A0A3M9Y1U4_9PEZI|nr:uncharacterized protein D7B24_000436 [Verticillium nonalfalfae]RNJ54463.1 hypothetical protein D7B24_000436 [Verticillium nonalfalfae]